MSREDVELLSDWESVLPSGRELKSAFADDAFLAGLGEIVDPEAKIRFLDAENGALGDLELERRGVEGLRDGWAQWLDAWEEFWIDFEQYLDAGEGLVLALVELRGRTQADVEISHPAAALVRVRDRRIVSMDFYMDRKQARRDVGLA